MSDILKFSIPVMLIKDEGQFIVSCESLSIYSQASSEKVVMTDFETCMDILFEKWQKSGKLFQKLNSKGLFITSLFQGGDYEYEMRLESKISIPQLKLGNNSSLKGKLVSI